MRIILCHFPQGQQSQANAQNWGLSHSFFYSWASDPKAGSCWAFIPSLGGNNGFQLHQGKEVFMVSLWGASTEGASFHPSSKFFGNNSSSINCPVKKKKSKNYFDWYLNVSTSKQVTMGCDVLVVHLTEHRKTHLGGSSWVNLWRLSWLGLWSRKICSLWVARFLCTGMEDCVEGEVEQSTHICFSSLLNCGYNVTNTSNSCHCDSPVCDSKWWVNGWILSPFCCLCQTILPEQQKWGKGWGVLIWKSSPDLPRKFC